MANKDQFEAWAKTLTNQQLSNEVDKLRDGIEKEFAWDKTLSLLDEVADRLVEETHIFDPLGHD